MNFSLPKIGGSIGNAISAVPLLGAPVSAYNGIVNGGSQGAVQGAVNNITGQNVNQSPKINGSIGNAISAVPLLGAPVSAYNGLVSGGPKGAVQGVINNITGENAYQSLMGPEPSQPQAPGTNPNLQALQQQQLQNAASFRAGIPGMSNQMGSNLAQASNVQTRGQLQNTNNNNNARGLLYGGVNAGQKQAIRGNNQQSLAQGQSNINAQLQNQANTLDTQAVQTGVGIQQTQQTIQNQIYSQALAQMQAQNAGFAGVGAAGGLIAGAAIAA